MKLNQLFSGFGLHKRVPRREIENRQALLNKLKQKTGNVRQVKEQQLLQRNVETFEPLSDAGKNSVLTLAQRIKQANKAYIAQKTPSAKTDDRAREMKKDI